MTKQQLIDENAILKAALKRAYEALTTEYTGIAGKDTGYIYAYRTGAAQSCIEYVQKDKKIDLGIKI
jgi:hypothetical protein